MRKPWEETWEYRAPKADIGYVTPFQTVCGFLSVDEDAELNPPEDARARAKIASAAPEMARLLLALEWSGSECYYDGCDAVCPCCRKEGPRKSRFSAKILGGEHAEDCALAAVLRKAGVRT